MKQFQMEYISESNFYRELCRIKRFCDRTIYSNIVFHIYIVEINATKLQHITSTIESRFPDAFYVGGQSYGNIFEGRLSKDVLLITCSVFEEDDTDIEVITIQPKQNNCPFSSLHDLWTYCNSKTNLCGVELISSPKAMQSLKIGEETVDLPENVVVFGNMSVNYPDLTNDAIVFSKGNPPSSSDCLAILYSGSNLHINCTYTLGWKPLGKTMTVTECQGNIIKKIDDMPSFEIYKKYLNADNDERLQIHQTWFPLLIEKHGVDCLRVPAVVNEDNSMVMTVDVDERTKVRLSYGDRNVIINNIKERLHDVFEFEPQAIKVISCGGRRWFWNDNDVSLETEMFEDIAPTCGLYSGGEILRIGSYLFHFNVTFITIAFREGEKLNIPRTMPINIGRTKKSTMNAKLAYFIGAVTQELENALYTDALSGIANRRAFKEYIDSSYDTEDMVIVSVDLDGLKKANDELGHAAGDELIRASATILNDTFSKLGKVFRTGGDEFIAILNTKQDIRSLKFELEKNINNWCDRTNESLHLSVGLVSVKESPELDIHDLLKLADCKMYEAKNNYYSITGSERRK